MGNGGIFTDVMTEREAAYALRVPDNAVYSLIRLHEDHSHLKPGEYGHFNGAYIKELSGCQWCVGRLARAQAIAAMSNHG